MNFLTDNIITLRELFSIHLHAYFISEIHLEKQSIMSRNQHQSHYPISISN